MKTLLMSRKKAFSIYIIACFIPVASQLMGNFVFAYLLGGIENASLSFAYRGMVIGIGFVVLSTLMYMISRFLRIRFMRDTILDVRLLAFDKILKMDFHNFSKKSKEVYISNLINDVNLFEKNFFLKLLNVIFLGGTYAFTVLILIFLDLKFGLVVFGLSLVLFYITKSFEGKTVALQQDVSDLNETFTVEVSNTFNGMEILKLNSIESIFLDKTMRSVERVERRKLYYSVFTAGQRSLSMIMGSFIFIGLIIYLLLQVRGGMSVEQMVFMLQLGMGCIWPLQNLVPTYNELKSSVNIYNKITVAPEVESVQKGTVPYRFEKAIQVENLTYTYDDRTVLDNISFTLEKGKKYLLKGESGSGKSTLIKILSKTYTDYKGSVAIDDVDLRSTADEHFNRHVSFIYQDVFLFEDTLANNITLFGDVNEEKLKYAVSVSGLNDFVERDAAGCHQLLLENGKNLSGGERQRVSIARAVYKETDILFADEATSSLNHELGLAVEKAILELPCTVVAVSHRYYDGITNQYDYVLALKDGVLHVTPAEDYFEKERVA